MAPDKKTDTNNQLQYQRSDENKREKSNDPIVHKIMMNSPYQVKRELFPDSKILDSSLSNRVLPDWID